MGLAIRALCQSPEMLPIASRLNDRSSLRRSPVQESPAILHEMDWLMVTRYVDARMVAEAVRAEGHRPAGSLWPRDGDDAG